MARRFLLATPCYGDPCPDYVLSMLGTLNSFAAAGLGYDIGCIQGLCYVHQARNWLVQGFLDGKADAIVFIDSDIGWNPDELVRMVQIDKAIVGAAAPYRGPDGGFPVLLRKDKDGCPIGKAFNDDSEAGLLEASIIPTAMIKVERAVFERLIKLDMAPFRIERDKLSHKENKRWRSFFDFEAVPDPYGSNGDFVEYGEDVTFCRKCAKAGFELFVDPRLTLRHWGKHGVAGCLHSWLKEKGANNGTAVF